MLLLPFTPIVRPPCRRLSLLAAAAILSLLVGTGLGACSEEIEGESDATADAPSGWETGPLTDSEEGLADSGQCINGAKCTVIGTRGVCARGKAVCLESGIGYCEQVTFPASKEVCDGADRDCDGLSDSKDPDAKSNCGAGMICNGSKCVTAPDAGLDQGIPDKGSDWQVKDIPALDKAPDKAPVPDKAPDKTPTPDNGPDKAPTPDTSTPDAPATAQ